LYDLQNILEKFNPESKKMLINAKAYLKALHNSSQTSKIFADSLSKIARNARESTQGTSDIGKRLDHSRNINICMFAFFCKKKNFMYVHVYIGKQANWF
jgi:hypothetical protein